MNQQKILRLMSISLIFIAVIWLGRIESSSHHLDANCPGIENETSNFLRTFWNWRLTNSPEFATSIGVYDYDDQLREMSLSSFSRRKKECRRLLEEAKKIQSKIQSIQRVLSGDERLNIDLLISELEQYLYGMEFRAYLWPLNMLESPSNLFPKLLSWMKKETLEDYRKILKRIRLFPQQIDERIRLLKEGIRLNLTMHKVSFETLPKILIDLTQIPANSSEIFKPFLVKPNGILKSLWDDLSREATELIKSEIYPSYKKLSDFLRYEYMEHSRPGIGVSTLPNGTQYYLSCVKFHTTTDLTPLKIHQIGIAEVARITNRMNDVKEKVDFKGTLKDFHNYLRTDKQFKFKSSEEILLRYRNVTSSIDELLSRYFKELPKAEYKVLPVPDDIAPTFPDAYYNAPSPDGSRPGTFLINTYRPESQNVFGAVSLSLHEATPGHHLQTALTMQSSSLPDFRRFMEDNAYYEAPGRFGMYTAYGEGWALYAEFLGEEMELYSDPYDLFGRLSDEMFRACRLVVDTGMHALGWSREKAIKYMEANTPFDIHGITKEINRYITWPGQALGYKIGEMKIKELRKKAESKLKEKFDLRLFHHTVASMGNVPLDILEKQIDTFITEQIN